MGRSGTQFDARTVATQEAGAPPAVSEAHRRKLLQRTGLVVALLILAAIVSVVVHHFVYPALSWNRDEVTYLWQVRGLRAGDLLTTAGPTPHFFQPWLVGLTGDQFFSQYTLGWPGVMLVADVLFGSPLMAQVFGTVLGVLGVYVFTAR